VDSPLIHDRGRGPELRRTRITVYDIVGYLEVGDDDATILQWLPITAEELAALKRYIADHRDEVMADYRQNVARREREMAASRVSLATHGPPETDAERQERLRAYSQFVTDMKADPGLFPEIPGEEPDCRRRRLIQACEERWQAIKAARTVAA
jgi:uncharacterized protein (DUF433 family)